MMAGPFSGFFEGYNEQKVAMDAAEDRKLRRGLMTTQLASAEREAEKQRQLDAMQGEVDAAAKGLHEPGGKERFDKAVLQWAMLKDPAQGRKMYEELEDQSAYKTAMEAVKIRSRLEKGDKSVFQNLGKFVAGDDTDVDPNESFYDPQTKKGVVTIISKTDPSKRQQVPIDAPTLDSMVVGMFRNPEQLFKFAQGMKAIKEGDEATAKAKYYGLKGEGEEAELKAGIPGLKAKELQSKIDENRAQAANAYASAERHRSGATEEKTARAEATELNTLTKVFGLRSMKDLEDSYVKKRNAFATSGDDAKVKQLDAEFEAERKRNEEGMALATKALDLRKKYKDVGTGELAEIVKKDAEIRKQAERGVQAGKSKGINKSLDEVLEAGVKANGGGIEGGRVYYMIGKQKVFL